MAALGSQSIASSYEQLLHVDTNGGGSTTTLVPVKDGDNGTTFAMQLSTTTVCIDNPTADSSTQGGILRLQSDDGALMQSGSRLGVIEFAGAEDSSSTITVGGRIESVTDAAWSASENGADMVFYTTDGNASQTERFRIKAAGNVGITEGSGLYFDGIDDTYIASTADDILKFYTGAAARMVLDDNSRISLSNNDDGGNNTIFGKTAGDPDGAGDFNVYIGELAGGAGTQTDDSDYNIGVGYASLTALTQGAKNIAIGAGALESMTIGDHNIALGHQALMGTSTGQADDNVAIGYQAMSGNMGSDQVDDCVAIGSGALAGALSSSNGADEASGTVAIGASALAALTSGAGNIGVGYGALKQHTTGARNIAIGFGAMDGTGQDDAPTSTDNVFIGYDAGGGAWDDGADSTDDSNFNVGIGNYTMDAAMDGALGNTAVGHESLSALTTGTNNVIVGRLAGGQITSSSDNTLVGYKAGYDMTTSSNLAVAVGESALENITTATRVTAVGYQAGMLMTTGSSNVGSMVAVGTLALKSATGGKNTAVGSASGDVVTTGIENTLLGADTNVAASGSNNQTVVGYGTTGVADNSVTLGNADVTRVNMSSDGAAVMYADGTINTSDIRFKENIEDTDLGLSFINSLRPVKYNFIEDKHDGKTKYGIIAQEVIDVLNETGNMDFAGIKDDNKEKLGADYIQFIAPLMKAVQELTAKVEALENA